jgi:hypothetical protein
MLPDGRKLAQIAPGVLRLSALPEQISSTFPHPVRKMSKKSNHKPCIGFSEGKGHTFESYRVRQMDLDGIYGVGVQTG